MNNPYYQNPSPIGEPIIKLLGIGIDEDCITTIEWAETLHGFKFCESNVLKYLWRLGVKTREITSDCSKILHYIDRAIENGSHITEELKIARIEVLKLVLQSWAS